MKIKAGKYSVCVKKLMRYGFTKEAAEITCGNVAIKDTDWEVKKKEEVVSGFETEVTGEELHVTAAKKKKKLKTTAAGGKAVKREKGKERPIVSEPRAMQLPLFQPWRAFKSEHRLQTKLERIITAEEKFLTMEQLMKRAEYALAIKKKDSAPFIVYAIPEEVWDQAIGMGKPLGQTKPKGTTKQGYPIVQWIQKGGQRIPIVMTSKGAMTEAEAIKSGATAGGAGVSGGPSIKSMLGERAERRMELKGRIPISIGRTQREVAELKGLERDKLVMGLKEITKKTLEIKSPQQKYQEFKERQEREAAASIPHEEPITMEHLMELARFEAEVAYMESAPSFDIIGGDIMKEIDFDELREEDLWAHIKSDLNWTNRAKGEYEQLYQSIGKNPYTTSEVTNVINKLEAVNRIENTLILHDFIVHTKNDFLKKAALERLAKQDPSFFEEHIGDPTAPNRKKKDPTTYGIKKGAYKQREKEYNEMKAQKEAYLSQQQEFFQKDRPAKYVEKQFKTTKTDKEVGKAHDPDAGYQLLKNLGLVKEGKLTTKPRHEEE